MTPAAPSLSAGDLLLELSASQAQPTAPGTGLPVLALDLVTPRTALANVVHTGIFRAVVRADLGHTSLPGSYGQEGDGPK